MVTEIKSKCYTCLNPIALADLASLTKLSKALILITEALLFTTDCSPSKLDHRSPTHNNRRQTYTKQTRLQLEQYTNHIKIVGKVYKMILHIAMIPRT